MWRASVWPKPSVRDGGPWPRRVQRHVVLLRSPSRASAAAASRQRDAPSTTRSQSPAWPIARRACPRECAPFPHGRTHRPGCLPICPDAGPRARAVTSSLPPYSSSNAIDALVTGASSVPSTGTNRCVSCRRLAGVWPERNDRRWHARDDRASCRRCKSYTAPVSEIAKRPRVSGSACRPQSIRRPPRDA